MKVLGIIPARGGSKGVSRKNIRLVAGRPLIAYTIQAAKESKLLNHFVTSTEDNEIANIATNQGSPVLFRPKELAEDNTAMVDVIQHVIKSLYAEGQEYDVLCLLQPTSPLRSGKDIDAALQLLKEKSVDSVVSVVQVPGHYHPEWQFVIENYHLCLYNGQPLYNIITRRQELKPTYTRNGAIYACRVDFFLRNNALISVNNQAYLMKAECSVNIDDEQDFAFAEFLLHRRKELL